MVSVGKCDFKSNVNSKFETIGLDCTNGYKKFNPSWLSTESGLCKENSNYKFTNYHRSLMYNEELLQTPRQANQHTKYYSEISKNLLFTRSFVCKDVGTSLYKKNLLSDNGGRSMWSNYFAFEKLKRAKEVYYGYGDYINTVFNIAFDKPRITSDLMLFKKRILSHYIDSSCKSRPRTKKERSEFLYADLKRKPKHFSIFSINTPKSYTDGRFKRLFYKKTRKYDVKRMVNVLSYPVSGWVKRTLDISHLKLHTKTTYETTLVYQQHRRHPSSQSVAIQKILRIGSNMDSFFFTEREKGPAFDFSRFYKAYWKFFKFKMEKFFFTQMTTRIHVWFLNIWDVFLNSVDAVWRWFRYENRATFFLTKKGQRFFIEDREDAKFYVRALALTVTTVGGVKLFMDKVSLMMKRYRNNWAFILNTVKSLRTCINYFWFRFFVNYKITLQGKVGGFLRAQKKTFKKGNVSVESKESAITYYRGYPVTRFGSYNLSFWLQYRIPNLIEKFGDSEYIDTMKILLSMYSVPWLARRLSEIIEKMLLERVYVVNRKLAQYARRKRARLALVYDVLKIKKYHFKHTKLKLGTEHKFQKMREIVLKKKNKAKSLLKPTKLSVLKSLSRRFRRKNKNKLKLSVDNKIKQKNNNKKVKNNAKKGNNKIQKVS